MVDGNDRPVLEYRTPPRARPPRIRNWFNYNGTDTAIGSTALFFAMLIWLSVFVGVAMNVVGAGLCFALPMAGLAVVCGLIGLCERQSSKFFPSSALMLVAIYVLMFL